jgi:hypothetical protein
VAICPGSYRSADADAGTGWADGYVHADTDQHGYGHRNQHPEYDDADGDR